MCHTLHIFSNSYLLKELQLYSNNNKKLNSAISKDNWILKLYHLNWNILRALKAYWYTYWKHRCKLTKLFFFILYIVYSKKWLLVTFSSKIIWKVILYIHMCVYIYIFIYVRNNSCCRPHLINCTCITTSQHR